METDAVEPGRSLGDIVVVDEVGPLASAAASVWTDYPSTPRWFYPGFGLAAGLVVLAVGGAAEYASGFLLFVPVAAALFASQLVWYVHAWGNWPSSAWPTAAEFRPVMYAYLAGCLSLLPAAIGIVYLLGAGVAAVLVAGVAWLGLTVYERRYEAAAWAAMARLSASDVAPEVRVEVEDPAFSEPGCLELVAILANTEGCDMTFLRRQVELSDDELFEALSKLLAAEYLKITEWFGRSWYSLNKAGREAAKAIRETLDSVVRGKAGPA